jgi:hypothetical protein
VAAPGVSSLPTLPLRIAQSDSREQGSGCLVRGSTQHECPRRSRDSFRRDSDTRDPLGSRSGLRVLARKGCDPAAELGRIGPLIQERFPGSETGGIDRKEANGREGGPRHPTEDATTPLRGRRDPDPEREPAGRGLRREGCSAEDSSSYAITPAIRSERTGHPSGSSLLSPCNRIQDAAVRPLLPSRRMRRHTIETCERPVAASVPAFGERGFDGASKREICARADVAQPAFCHLLRRKAAAHPHAWKLEERRRARWAERRRRRDPIASAARGRRALLRGASGV